ncbi:MAG: hypothetical protein FWF96_00445 [Kiritimatiellaeota bacterium]|nr:hypothetical protein [Kiritimatiellota bacterium]
MKKIIPRQTLLVPLAVATVVWAAKLPAQEAEAETPEVWRPAPPVTKIPYPLRPVVSKDRQRHERLDTMTLDGTFESYANGTPISQIKDKNGSGIFFGVDACRILNTGYKSRSSLLIPSGGGTTCGIEEKNHPLKPDTWYRVSMMLKGVPYRLSFYYPTQDPTANDGKDGANNMVIDHNHGGGYSFYYVCSKCEYVKEGGAADGNWVIGGFRVIPDACPECGAEGSLYRDGDRRNYPEWTFVFADFKTSDYVGRMSNGVYYWYTVFITGAANTQIDDFLVYEITGEGGDPVRGDEYTAPEKQ